MITQLVWRTRRFVRQDGKKAFLLWRTGVAIVVASLARIEETNPEFTFIRVDRDQYMDLAKLWDVYGILALLLRKDKEIGRLAIVTVKQGRN